MKNKSTTPEPIDYAHRPRRNRHIRVRVHEDTRLWLEQQAMKENRSLSNFLDVIIEEARARREATAREKAKPADDPAKPGGNHHRHLTKAAALIRHLEATTLAPAPHKARKPSGSA